jgi:hypothetical protein
MDYQPNQPVLPATHQVALFFFWGQASSCRCSPHPRHTQKYPYRRWFVYLQQYLSIHFSSSKQLLLVLAVRSWSPCLWVHRKRLARFFSLWVWGSWVDSKWCGQYTGGVSAGRNITFIDVIAESVCWFPSGSMCSSHVIFIIESMNLNIINWDEAFGKTGEMDSTVYTACFDL